MADVQLKLQKAASVNSEVAHILVEIPEVFKNRINETEVAKSVSKSIRGARYLPNSMHRVGSDARTKNLFGMYVRSAPDTKTMEQASTDGLTQVSDTVFQDSGDNIWSVRSDGQGNPYLAADSSEDIAELLKSVERRNIATASTDIGLDEYYSVGTPVMFYDTEKEQASFGIGVDDTRVFVPDEQTIQTVPYTTVIAAFDKPTGVNMSRLDNKPIQTAINYYEGVFGRNREFFQQIREILNKAAIVKS